VPGPATAAPPAADTRLNDAIKAAVSRSDALLEDERFTQAADALRQAIGPAARALGPESPRVLRLREAPRRDPGAGWGLPERAAGVRRASRGVQPHLAGPASERTLNCLRQAAHCRAELGHTTAALRLFQRVLTQVRRAGGGASPTALDLRRNIGVLLLADGNTVEAGRTLRPLYDDLVLLFGPDHEETREVADILTRLRITGDALTGPWPSKE
jgi:hypothetical protein